MIKLYHYGILLLGAAISTNALAACQGSKRVKANTTPTLAFTLTGNTICGTEFGGAAFQEEHRTAPLNNNFMELWDYKKGPGDPADPTARIGKWKITNNGNKVRYKYGSGSSAYSVHEPSPGVYEFCTSNNGTLIVDNVTIVNGIGSGC